MKFFKNVWNSVTKIEKYPDMAAEGIKKAISYLLKIVAILCIVLCLGIMYQAYQVVQEGTNYLKDEFPEFSYKEGNLNVEQENPIIIANEKNIVDYVIIDTKTEEEQKINEYINEITQNGEGVIVLKDKVILKNDAIAGTISYAYKQTLEPMNITEFTKQDVINYANSTKVISLYISVFLTIFVYAFIMYLLTTASNALILSFFGYITTLIAKIKMRYVAIFNMAVYALTLSTFLNILYIAVNIFVPFEMEYFQVMYVSVAAIYLVAAILILKTDIIKQQIELMRIAEVEKQIKEKMKEEEKKEQEEKEREEQKKKEQEKEKKENDEGAEPQGSNA